METKMALTMLAAFTSLLALPGGSSFEVTVLYLSFGDSTVLGFDAHYPVLDATAKFIRKTFPA